MNRRSQIEEDIWLQAEREYEEEIDLVLRVDRIKKRIKHERNTGHQKSRKNMNEDSVMPNPTTG
jgi:hypothetical protein